MIRDTININRNDPMPNFVQCFFILAYYVAINQMKLINKYE